MPAAAALVTASRSWDTLRVATISAPIRRASRTTATPFPRVTSPPARGFSTSTDPLTHPPLSFASSHEFPGARDLGDRPPAARARARARTRSGAHGPGHDGRAALRRHPVRGAGARRAPALQAGPDGAGGGDSGGGHAAHGGAGPGGGPRLDPRGLVAGPVPHAPRGDAARPRRRARRHAGGRRPSGHGARQRGGGPLRDPAP